MGRLDVDMIQETSGVLKKSAGGQHANANEWDARLCGTLSHLAPPQTHVRCATPIVRTYRHTSGMYGWQVSMLGGNVQ